MTTVIMCPAVDLPCERNCWARGAGCYCRDCGGSGGDWVDQGGTMRCVSCRACGGQKYIMIPRPRDMSRDSGEKD